MIGHGRRLRSLEERALEMEAALDAMGAKHREESARFHELINSEEPEQRLAGVINSLSVQLAGQVERVTAELGDMRRALDEMAQLRLQLESSANAGVCRAPRVFGELGRTYCAEWTGYVALYFDGGATDIVELLVGETSPPSQVVGRINCQNGFNSYGGAVVRRGEYWLARSSLASGSGVRCVFTPFA